MKYVTEEYYQNEFRGESISDNSFSILCTRAEEIIEDMTLYRVNEVSFETMPENLKKCIKNAVCAQIEYLDVNGGSDLDNNQTLQSAGLGKFSYTTTNLGSTQAIYAPRAMRILIPTGLLYRGGGCH